MFIELSRNYFARSIATERKVASWLASGFRSQPVTAPPRTPNLDSLRARLERANHRVAESERLVVGWRDVIGREQASRHDLSVARDLLKTFESGLEVATNEKREAENALRQRLLDLFEGVRSRPPQNDQELHERLASPEGKAATAFEPVSLSPWGE